MLLLTKFRVCGSVGVFDFLFLFELHWLLCDIFDTDNDNLLLNDDDDVDNDDNDDDDDCGGSFDKK